MSQSATVSFIVTSGLRIVNRQTDTYARRVAEQPGCFGCDLPYPLSAILYSLPSYKLLALAAQLDRALLRQLANDRQDFFLRGLDFGQPHRAFGFQIVLQHFSCTLRHVLEDLLFESLVRALHGNQQT